jgi:uncharacterized protein (TIGR02594 family)
MGREAKMKPYDMAEKFLGLSEIAGDTNNGFIQWSHSLCGLGPETPDEVPWCSSFVNAIAWLCGAKRSRSAAARSWLTVGDPVELANAQRGDVVIFKRGSGPQPGPEVLKAPGHVALFHSMNKDRVWVLGGNQSNAVSVVPYSSASVLGVRRIA